MSKANTICRVCRKEYFCCSDSQKVNSWKTMACSPECFEEYMKRIEESRRPKVNVEKKSVAKKVKPEKNKPCVEMDETSDENNNLLKE